MISVQSNAIQNEKSIVCPIIRQDFFIFNTLLVDNFIHRVNTEIKAHNKVCTPDQKRQKVRDIHRELFIKILFEARKQLERNAKMVLTTETMYPAPMQVGEPLKISTNNAILAVALGKACNTAKSTIYRRLQRLKECNFFVSITNAEGEEIKSVFHGTRSDYDLFINPDLLILFDAANANFAPETPRLLNPKSKNAFASKIAKCNLLHHVPYHCENNKTIIHPNQPNNESAEMLGEDTMPVEIPCVNNSSDSSQTPEMRGSGSYSDIQPGGAWANYVNHQWGPHIMRSFIAAKEVYGFAIELLWDGNSMDDNKHLPFEHRTVCGGKLWGNNVIIRAEEEKTIIYLMTHYFQKDTSPQALSQQINNIKGKLVMARRNLMKKDYYLNGKWFVTPSQYFEVGNDNGFTGTHKWFANQLEFEKKRTRTSENRKKFYKAVNQYLNNPDIQEFNKQLAYIQKNLPHMETEFIKQTTGKLDVPKADPSVFVSNLRNEIAENLAKFQ